MTHSSSIVFKAQPPEQTIAQLRNALRRLDLSVTESRWRYNPAAMSLRLDIDELPFGANGKGVDKSYALASAYAELFERIQNISIFNSVYRFGNTDGIALRYPDEVSRRYTLGDVDGPYLRHLFFDRAAKHQFLRYGSHASIPFYNISKKEIVYLPERVLSDTVGTNGMCAGNTPTEAIIQGLCEICERYVLKQLLCGHEEPPEIPLAYVTNDIVEHYLVPLQQYGYQVYLKDCTLGGRFPVFGVFIRRGDRGLLHLGCAPDMRIALERCFTELLQSTTVVDLDSALQPIVPDADAKTMQFWQQEFHQAFRNYRSVQRSSMFRNAALMPKRNIFVCDDLTSMATLKRLTSRIEDLGYDVLVRDNTFLGFPAFQLFIPGLSELRPLDSRSLTRRDRLKKARDVFFNLDGASGKDLLFLGSVIEELDGAQMVDKMEIMQVIHNIPIRRTSRLCLLDYRFFHSIIHFHTGDYSEAARLLNEFVCEMEFRPGDIPAAWYCMRDIFKLCAKPASWDAIHSYISKRYPEKDVLDSYFPLLKIENVRKYFAIPHCEDCRVCQYRDCAVRTGAHYAKRFQAMIDANMKQDAIRMLFSKATNERRNATPSAEKKNPFPDNVPMNRIRRVNEDKPVLHCLSPGCESCMRGDWLCLYITPDCNLDCFYCISPLDRADRDYPKTPENIPMDIHSYLDYLKIFDFQGISFSGGEPFLQFETLLRYIRATRDEFGDQHYIWLYTNGTLVTKDKLKKLRDSGVQELRFDIAANRYELDSVALAAKYIESVSVEIPAIPADVGIVKQKLPQMESLGVKHLNLHELVLNRRNRRALMSRGYGRVSPREDDEEYAVAGSRLAAFDIMRHGEGVLTKMGVNYCSYDYKKKYQKRGYRRRWSCICREEGDQITNSGFMRKLTISGRTVRSLDDALRSDRLGKAMVTYYRPELQKVENDDKAYDPCELKGRGVRYKIRRSLLCESKFDSALQLFIYSKLFESRVEPECLVRELSSSIKASDAKQERISALVHGINERFKDLE